jgi:hypothetical protein
LSHNPIYLNSWTIWICLKNEWLLEWKFHYCCGYQVVLTFIFKGKLWGNTTWKKKFKHVRKKLVANLNYNLNLVLFYITIYVHTINSKDIIYLYNIVGGRPFYPSVLSSVSSSIHPSSSSRKKKMMEEDDDEWRQQQFIQTF